MGVREKKLTWPHARSNEGLTFWKLRKALEMTR
jgi:hypothetical protein